MTVPSPTHGRPRPAGASVGDRRGLTAAGAAGLALLIGLLGAGVDIATGSGLREAFAIAFVSGSLIAAGTVHREDLVASVVMPPLVFVVLVLVAGLVEGSGASGSLVMRQAVELVNALVLSAPVLMAGTLAALVVAVARRTLGRR